MQQLGGKQRSVYRGREKGMAEDSRTMRGDHQNIGMEGVKVKTRSMMGLS